MGIIASSSGEVNEGERGGMCFFLFAHNNKYRASSAHDVMKTDQLKERLILHLLYLTSTAEL